MTALSWNPYQNDGESLVLACGKELMGLYNAITAIDAGIQHGGTWVVHVYVNPLRCVDGNAKGFIPDWFEGFPVIVIYVEIERIPDSAIFRLA